MPLDFDLRFSNLTSESIRKGGNKKHNRTATKLTFGISDPHWSRCLRGFAETSSVLRYHAEVVLLVLDQIGNIVDVGADAVSVAPDPIVAVRLFLLDPVA